MTRLIIESNHVIFSRYNCILVGECVDSKFAIQHEIMQDAPVEAIALSQDHSTLVVLNCNKKLKLWSMEQKDFIQEREIPRNATNLRCAMYRDGNGQSRECIIIGDKTGEVFAYSLLDLSQSQSLLQHTTSMITSIVMSNNYDFLISADRDEKIRISSFPNTWITNGYCLGHKSFIGVIATIPKYPDLLLSFGGDGTIRLWNFKTKDLLDTFSIPEEIISETVVAPCSLFAIPGEDCIKVYAFVSNSNVVITLNIERFKFQEGFLKEYLPQNPQGSCVDINQGVVGILYDEEPFVDVVAITESVVDFQCSILSMSTVLQSFSRRIVGPGNIHEAKDLEGPLTKKRTKTVDWKSKTTKTIN